jgi:acyl-CoA hydrolase
MHIDDWGQQRKDSEIKAADLHRFIKPGSRIFIGTGCSVPVKLTGQLAQNKNQFNDCEIVHFLTLSGNHFFDDA